MTEARVNLISDMQFEGRSSSGHRLVMDADDGSGGHNKGIRPTELLLVGFGGCSGMDVISILRKKRQGVAHYEVRVEGEQRADEHPHLFERMTVTHVVEGDVDVDAVRRAVEL